MDWMDGLDEDFTGAVDVAAMKKLMGVKTGGGAYLGSLIKDPKKAAALIRKIGASKSKTAQRMAGVTRALMAHEAIAAADARSAPTTLVNLFFSAVAAGGSSATASVRTPYSNQRWALRSIESFCTASPDPGLLIALNPGGVDQAVTPTTQAVTWSAGAPQAGIPTAKFNTLATRRDAPDYNYRPWARRSRVFEATDVFQVQVYNAGAAVASWFILLNLISSPCAGQGFKMRSVHPTWFSRVWKAVHSG